jgi:hypothetical protein
MTPEIEEYLWQSKANDNFRTAFARELFYWMKQK